MEEKKKVKSIKEAEISEKDRKEKIRKIEMDDDYDYENEGRRKLKKILFFLLGIIFIIWLLSIFANRGSNIASGINKVYDATVYIENYNGAELVNAGSGFVYRKSKGIAYILTNYSVISGNTSIRVVFSNDKKVDAKYIGGDQYSDIAVLSVPATHVKRVAKIGSSKKVKVGSTVFAIGSPAGNAYRGTVTKGILSGKNRLVNVSVNGGASHNMKLLQTDADMDYGNSGGPLCNSKGQVIGMNSLKLVKETINGTNFAIAIEDVMRRIKLFETGVTTEKPYIGIKMVNLSDDSSLNYYGLSKKLNTTLTQGVVVESIVKGSSADGKLKVADIITKINDESVFNMSYLRYELSKYSVGDKVKITVERNGKYKDISIKLGSKSDN